MERSGEEACLHYLTQPTTARGPGVLSDTSATVLLGPRCEVESRECVAGGALACSCSIPRHEYAAAPSASDSRTLLSPLIVSIPQRPSCWTSYNSFFFGLSLAAVRIALRSILENKVRQHCSTKRSRPSARRTARPRRQGRHSQRRSRKPRPHVPEAKRCAIADVEIRAEAMKSKAKGTILPLRQAEFDALPYSVQ